MESGDALLRSLGETVRSLRKHKGWSRRELAASSGISERFLADVESGVANPSLLRLFELAQALGTMPDQLLAQLHPPRPVRPVVALLGLRGAGKSTVGPRLARRLHRGFFELDIRIEERAALSTSEIFQLHGEVFYRRLERESLEELLASERSMVLATSGGVVSAAETFALLRAATTTVWLRAKPQDHWQRVIAQGDTRPMANNARAFQELCALLSEREALYRLADLTVETSDHSVEDVVAMIHDQLGVVV